MEELNINIPDNGYIKSLFELDEIRDSTANGKTATDMTSRYLASFDGIPRAKIAETEIADSPNKVRRFHYSPFFSKTYLNMANKTV